MAAPFLGVRVYFGLEAVASVATTFAPEELKEFGIRWDIREQLPDLLLASLACLT